MKRLISRVFVTALVMYLGAYGSLAYTAYRQMPKTITEHRYARCAEYLHKLSVRPAPQITKASRARQRRCARLARRFERRHGGRAEQITRKLPSLPGLS